MASHVNKWYYWIIMILMLNYKYAKYMQVYFVHSTNRFPNNNSNNTMHSNNFVLHFTSMKQKSESHSLIFPVTNLYLSDRSLYFSQMLSLTYPNTLSSLSLSLSLSLMDGKSLPCSLILTYSRMTLSSARGFGSLAKWVCFLACSSFPNSRTNKCLWVRLSQCATLISNPQPAYPDSLSSTL